MLSVRPYRPDDLTRWEQVVCESRSGHFLVSRAYMTYHSHRFEDASLVVEQDGSILAVFPANRRGAVIGSHDGLTFAGLVGVDGLRSDRMLSAFEALLDYYRRQGVTTLRYKPVPHIYHRAPAEEDLYALFRFGGTLVRRDTSSAIDSQHRLPVSKGRRWSLKKAKACGVSVHETTDYATFMQIEAQHLREKYDVAPTHTARELELLAMRFPENIRCYAAIRDGTMLGGVVIYEGYKVAHAQYIGATPEGWECGAVDVVLDFLIASRYKSKSWFDFGISTEAGGMSLNKGLAQYKESWGARAVTYDQYEVKL